MNRKKSVYIAGMLDNRPLLRLLKEYIELNIPYVSVNSRWLDLKTKTSLGFSAEIDYEDLEQSDLLFATWPGQLGTSSEIGYAMGSNKPIILYMEKTLIPDLNNTEDHGIGLLPIGKIYDNIITEVHEIIPAIKKYL